MRKNLLLFGVFLFIISLSVILLHEYTLSLTGCGYYDEKEGKPDFSNLLTPSEKCREIQKLPSYAYLPLGIGTVLIIYGIDFDELIIKRRGGKNK